MVALVDISGQRFGRWTVLALGPATNKHRKWRCRCDCGNEALVNGGTLRCGASRSCGCLGREEHIASITTHGMTDSPLYRIWQSMRGRCENPKRVSFKNYGARGIKVCARWGSFEDFALDMGEAYVPGLTLERVNNDGDYEPSNCKWVPRSQQSGNRRNARLWDFSSAPIVTNKSGYRGVSWDKSKQKWAASISINRKQTNLGRFETREAAAEAYRAAAATRHQDEGGSDTGVLRSAEHN